MIAVSVRRENVFPSPDLYIFAPSGREWVYAVNTGALADKLLFGSGFPLGGSLVRCVNRFLLLGFKPRTLDRILRRNALRALGLEGNPRFAALAAAPDAFSALSVPRRRFASPSTSPHASSGRRSAPGPGERRRRFPPAALRGRSRPREREDRGARWRRRGDYGELDRRANRVAHALLRAEARRSPCPPPARALGRAGDGLSAF
ncbi:MAG: hypothetical protein IPP07_30835 [Holophagales bacterium]|nr:hypothetical protein [Holophagales bacterium]